ncbi:glycosyltransferase [Polynucleobacter sp. 78F-HAINBA]|uniref:glycosyltransferase family A protein n=1 Tax=Polynucleobacter sp. 78F-HAINBA TaxID=2689099 RepID=UPI001C0C6165|nr:glycosyltransferase family 2 protein [Polynucleobacter sp. 78F-HAINBA]MBU3590689.1 glycosyltransferase [Polynucleobacter sp. 78F-HAINBA]
MPNVLEIFLLTHNRPLQAIEAVRSILAQSDQRFRLIVSDNSSNDGLSVLLGSFGSSLTYVYRNNSQCLSAFDHFNLCISEVNSQYFSLLHDDDLVLPNYVSDFWGAKKAFPNAIAFGCNARVRHLNGIEHSSFINSRRYFGPITPHVLAWQYFGRHKLGIAPFPFYIYNKAAIGSTRFSVQMGKYSDVAWLLDLANTGQMMWINAIMGIYQLHEGNDSNFESRQDRLRFLAYLKQHKLPNHTLLVTLYRQFLYKKLLPSDRLVIDSRRFEILRRYMADPFYRAHTSFYNLIALVAKCKVKTELFIMKTLDGFNAIR